MAEMFETAIRKKYRFPFKGHITTEDLWDLTPNQLDSVYKTLMQVKKTMNEESLTIHQEGEDDLKLMIDIVKYVFATKQDELEKRKKAIENAEKKKHILEILAEKKDEAMRNMSEEDLMKLLEEI